MLLKRFTLLLVFNLSVLITLAADVEPMNVLFIGNSYTHMHSMPKLFEKIAVSKGIKINVEMSALSSHTFRMHSERVEMYEMIGSKKWDYVVLQGFSRELSYSPEYIDTASIPFLNRILDSIYYHNACTNVLLYMTWGYKDGFQEREEINTYQKMADSVRRGYQYISEIYSLPIVPVGDVFREIRSKSTLNLYGPDGQHPTLNGSYLIAYSFYSAIFKSSPYDTYLARKMDVQVARFMQETAYNFISTHLDTFRLVQNTLKVKAERSKKGEFFVHCSSNYPKADSIKWTFGDGTSSKNTRITHKYRKAGTYWVTLEVYDYCGIRTIMRKAVFKEPEKPSQKPNTKPKVILNPDKKI